MRVIVLILSLALCGCTAVMWSKTNSQSVSINGIYVSQERGELLVSSTKDGYIFKVEPNTAQVLSLRGSIVFKPLFQDFKIDRKNKVTGSMILTVNHKDLEDAQYRQLMELGFVDYESTKRSRMTISLTGKRYEIEGELPFQKLRKEYAISMSRPDTFLESVTKIIATPLTLTIDAVVVLPTVFIAATAMAIGAVAD